MGLFHFGGSPGFSKRRQGLDTGYEIKRFVRAGHALAVGTLMSVGLTAHAVAASKAPAAECQFAPSTQMNIDTGVEPQLFIDATCIDPVYNEDTFVITGTEQLSFQVPDGALIPYTEVTGYFPATNTPETLPTNVRQSPTTFRQEYVLRFPAKEYWQNRSFLQQHPAGGGAVDNRMAFTNGAFSIIWKSASTPNAVASHRHEAAMTKVANAYANKHYDNGDKIYNYFWGCSGGGVVAQAAAENTVGVWDGVQAQCTGTSVDSQYHSFLWQAHYTMAISQEKRDAIAAAAAPGGTGDIYAGLNEEERSVLNELLGGGYPLAIIGNHFTRLIPLIDPIGLRPADPTYEDDFWSKPGYAGVNPPSYLKAALVDGWATITDIKRDANGAPIEVQFDPATVPDLGTIGDTYLEYWVYADNGKTRLIDPERPVGVPTGNKRRYSLQGKFDPESGVLALTGTERDIFGGESPITNSPLLLDALKVGSKVRVNNRFILAMYFYPRHTVVSGIRSHDQYRNADGSAKYPQRPSIGHLYYSNYRTMGGRVETGDIKTRTMIIEGMGDNLSWPIFNASYAERIQSALGKEKAEDMMRFYLHDNGKHTTGGGEWGIFQQSIQDLMAWVEQGIAPPPSTRYSIQNGQVIPAPRAADRYGLQPVMNLTVNGGSRVEVGVNQPVQLAALMEMPPQAGKIVRYQWTVDGTEEAWTNLSTPKLRLDVDREIAFPEDGSYLIRLTVNGQRDGLLDPADQTLLRNFAEVRVVVGSGNTGDRYTTAGTRLNQLLEDPRAVEILEKHVPGLTEMPQIKMAGSLTLEGLAAYYPPLTKEILNKINTDFSALEKE